MAGAVSAVENPPLPLNPDRFAKLAAAPLFDLAKEMAGTESAFAMCLNVALLRGDKDFAAKLAAGITNPALAQAFHLYRAGGLVKNALALAAGPVMEAIKPNAPVQSIVLDAIQTARAHNAELHRKLMQKIAAAGPDVKMSPAIHAFLYRETKAALGDAAAEKISGESSAPAPPPAPVRIAGLTMIRNEGDLVGQCVGHMLEFCDFVIIFDDNSTDGAPEAVVAQFGAERVEILRRPDVKVFNEKITVDALFDGARRRGATHVLKIDADERASPELAKTLRERARNLRLGESLAVPFRQVFGKGFIDYGRYAGLNDSARLLPPWKDFLYCDAGGEHHPMPLHTPWLPSGFPRRRHFAGDDSLSLLHFEKANVWNALVKVDLYITRELFLYKTAHLLVLARYLPLHIVYNHELDFPPEADALAAPPSRELAALSEWRLKDAAELARHLPPEGRVLQNFRYWNA